VIERRDEPEGEPRRGLGFEREIGDDVRHDRLVDQGTLEGAAIGNMVCGLRHRLTHQPGRTDRKVEPRVVVHGDAGTDAVTRLADEIPDRASELDFGRGIGFVAALVLEPLDLQPVAGAVRQPSRDDEAGNALRGLREGEKHVRVRNGKKPFVADERP